MVVFELLSFGSILAHARIMDDDSSDISAAVEKLDDIATRLDGTEQALQNAVSSQESLMDKLQAALDSTGPPSASVLGALKAEMDVYPGYMDGLKVTGSVYVLESADDYLELKYNLKGLETSTTGGVHVHAGTSCYDASLPGGHHWTPTETIKDDPWGAGSKWESDAKGDGMGVIKIQSGYPKLQDNTGKVIVVHNAAGAKIACGVLVPMAALGTEAFTVYPGYTGSQQSISGTVLVSTYKDEHGDDVLQLAYNLENLESSTTGGFHIHQGTDCTSDAGGHFYNPSSMAGDPWGANKWTSDASGKGYGVMNFDSGFPNLATNDGHVIVVHDSSGAKAACAKLNSLASVSTTLSPMPGYSGKYMITGEVVATINATGSPELSWALAGMESDIYGGIHIHAGTTCGDVQGHYYDPDVTGGVDAWKASMWVSKGDGTSVSTSFTPIDSGYYTLTDNFNHAIVVHLHNGDKAACGQLNMPMNYLTVADDSDIKGDVSVWQDATGKLNVQWDLEGIKTEAGTLSVGAATSCEFNSMSDGDLYNYADEFGTSMSDLPSPWDAAKYTSADGKSKGSFAADIGIHGLQNIMGHVLFLKDASGTAIHCAQLIPMAQMGAGAATGGGDMPMTTEGPASDSSDGPAPDYDMLVANNALISKTTCSIMDEGFPGLYGTATPFNMTVNACAGTAPIHTPTISKSGSKVTVNVDHPAQMSDHYIEWLWFSDSDNKPLMWKNFAQPAEGKPEAAPPVNATWTVSSSMSGKTVTPYSYCNLHGLWVGESMTL